MKTLRIITIAFIVSFNLLYAFKNKNNNEIDNLIAFSKLYGYLRFFHPSDQSANLDWEKFAVYGVDNVLKCKNQIQLKETLKTLFYPIAPTMQIYSIESEIQQSEIFYERDTANLRIIAWQHYGAWFSKWSTTYRSFRVFEDADLYEAQYYPMIDSIDILPQEEKLFEAFPKKDEIFQCNIGDSIYCKFPLTLNCDSIGTIGKRHNYPYQDLQVSLDSIQINEEIKNNINVWLANVIIAWNIYNHFYPYFDVVDKDWNNVLEETLIETFEVETEFEFYKVLEIFTAKLSDGHASVYNPSYIKYVVPFQLEQFGKDFIVMSSLDKEIPIGSKILAIDGRPIEEIFYERISQISGSEYYKKSVALSQIGRDTSAFSAIITLVNNNLETEMIVKRVLPNYNKAINRYEPIKMLSDGIYYVNLYYLDEREMESSFDKIKNAKGVIYDLRQSSLVKRPSNIGRPQIYNMFKLLPHLTSTDMSSQKLLIPCFIYPDQRGVTYTDRSFTIEPDSIRFNSKSVFMVDSKDISSLETFISFVDYYRLGEIIGSPTAGANGDNNRFALIGGYDLGMTGIKVLRQDNSQFHNIGIIPTYEVTRTKSGVENGIDEYLQKALEVIKMN